MKATRITQRIDIVDLHFQIKGPAVSQISENGTARHLACLDINRGLDLTYHLTSTFALIRLAQAKWQGNCRHAFAPLFKSSIKS